MGCNICQIILGTPERKVKVKTLGTRLIQGFFGLISEKSSGNILIFLQFTKRMAPKAFHFIIPAVTTGSTYYVSKRHCQANEGCRGVLLYVHVRYCRP